MSTTGWSPLGPGCVIHEDKFTASGRVTAIAIQPKDPNVPNDTNKIYVGAATGGVWRSDDDGQHWKPLTDTEETLGVGCITLDRGRIIVGTGEFNTSGQRAPGMGLLFSTDGGVSWQRVPAPATTFDGLTISRIVVDPGSQNHAFAATSGGLFETADFTNPASPWAPVPVDPHGAADQPVCDLLLDGANPALLYVAISKTGVFHGSKASSFTQIPAPDPPQGRIAIALSPKHAGVLYAAFESSAFKDRIGIFATDAGQTAFVRKALISDNTQQGYNLVLAAVTNDPGIKFDLLFCGGTGLHFSDDSGSNWITLPDDPNSNVPLAQRDFNQDLHPDQHVLVQEDPSDPHKLWLGNDGGVWVSIDGGKLWQHRNRGLQALQCFAVAQYPSLDSVLLGGTQDNGAIRFDGSAAWVLSDSGDAFDVIIDPAKDSTWYSGYVWGRGPVNRSDDFGTTYSGKSFGLSPADYDDDKPHPFKLVLGPPDPAHPDAPTPIYAGSTKLYVSKDGGESWVQIKVGKAGKQEPFSTGTGIADGITAIAFADHRIYVGTWSGNFFFLQQAPDGVWSQVTGDDLPDDAKAFPISDIAVGPSDPDKVYVALGSLHTASDLVLREGHRRLLRRDGGLETGGSWTWCTVASSSPNPSGGKPAITGNAVNTLVIDPKDPKTIYAGCDVGVFVSHDHGTTWDWWNDDLPNVIVYDLAIHQIHDAATHKDLRLMRAATLGRGVWERPLDTTDLHEVDIYLRDNALDVGRPPTSQGPNPLDSSHPETLFSGAGLKSDNDAFRLLPPFRGGFNKLPSTVDYTPTGALDYIGFHDFKTVAPRHGANNRIFLEVNNRGPKVATNVQARLFFAAKDEGVGFANLPSDFWTKFPNSDPSDTSVWKPMVPVQTIAELRPAEPVVLTFDWSPPLGSPDRIGILAAITSPDDPINETGLELASIVANNKRIIVKETTVGVRSALVVAGIVFALGLLTVVGIETYEVASGRK